MGGHLACHSNGKLFFIILSLLVSKAQPPTSGTVRAFSTSADSIQNFWKDVAHSCGIIVLFFANILWTPELLVWNKNFKLGVICAVECGSCGAERSARDCFHAVHLPAEDLGCEKGFRTESLQCCGPSHYHCKVHHLSTAVGGCFASESPSTF